MTEPLATPGQLLTELGIRRPEDLDIEGIAQYCGATIRYSRLEGCEARIIGYKNQAIITVNAASPRGRQRFSAGHELGHWMRDRGTVAFQCEQQSLIREWSRDNPESRANRYASDLLLPLSLFRSLAYRQPITFASVRKLAETFEMSLTATAIRLVGYGSYPAMILYFGREGREWFIPGPAVERKLWPLENPGLDSQASKLLRGAATGQIGPVDVRADTWIKHPRADHYWIKEDSLRFGNGSVLTLLWWEDEQQVIDISEWEERQAARPEE